MKKSLALLLITATLSPRVFAETTDEGCEHPFSDVSDHWAEEQICDLYEEGILEGYSERTFSPNGEVTRAEFLKIVLLNLGYTIYAVQSAGFSDVNPGDWYYQYVTFARSKGFVSGYGDGSFHPNDPITRAEALAIITEVAGFNSHDYQGFESQFSDVNSSDWFATAVAVGVDYGIVEGYGDGSFRPNSNLTRAEASVIAIRALEALYDQ